jgi:type IV secretion system protein VirB11
MGAHSLRPEAISRGTRMLRTALGSAIATWLEDPAVIEVMLNPDGRIWIDRLTDGLADTGAWLASADGERIIRLIAHHVGAEVHSGSPRVSAELPETASVSKACFPRSSRRLPSRSASRRSRSSRSTIMSPPEPFSPIRRLSFGSP